MTPPVLGIAEIVINVHDLPKMKAFYQEVMGFQLSQEGCFEREGDSGNTGEPTIAFLKVSNSDTPLGRNLHPPFLVLIDFMRHGLARDRFQHVTATGGSFNHMAFEIAPETYQDWHAHLLLNGLEVTESTFLSVQGKAIFIRDPEDNTIELICQA